MESVIVRTMMTKEVVAPLPVNKAALEGLREELRQMQTNFGVWRRGHFNDCSTCQDGLTPCGLYKHNRQEYMRAAMLNCNRQIIVLCNALTKETAYAGGFCDRCRRPQKNRPDCMSVGCDALKQYERLHHEEIQRIRRTMFDGEPLFQPAPQDIPVPAKPRRYWR